MVTGKFQAHMYIRFLSFLLAPSQITSPSYLGLYDNISLSIIVLAFTFFPHLCQLELPALIFVCVTIIYPVLLGILREFKLSPPICIHCTFSQHNF